MQLPIAVVGKKGTCPSCDATVTVTNEPMVDLASLEQQSPVQPLQPTPQEPQQKVLTELTAKRLKIIRLVGIVLILISIPIAGIMSDQYGPTDQGYLLAGIVGGSGVLTWLVGTAMSWWQHG